jgi:uncharacterized phage protein (TIGR01671 family)
MREIKFRAWDKKEKKMKWVDHLSVPNFDSGAVSFLDSELKADGKYKALGEIELMQYTGLKDKNGKEIYEGDIIGDTEDWSIVIWCDKCIGWQLAWYDIDIDKKTCHMCDGDFDITETFENNIADNDEEVIGNIYENPELLNVKQ